MNNQSKIGNGPMSLEDMTTAICQHKVVPNASEIIRIHDIIPFIDISNDEETEEVC